MKSTHLVTGATGFIGAALVLKLLQQTSDDIVCLVRPRSEDAAARLHHTLRLAADAYGAPEGVTRSIGERCRAVAGDVERAGCGISTTEALSCTQFWHSAASLRFEDRYAEEISRVNVRGTAHALDLAARLGASHFNYVSTAYVAGAREGRILEAPCPADVRVNNLYERSKVEAEGLVAGDHRFGRRIFRPSIVIGHSHTLAAMNFSGMYGFLRKLRAFRGMMARTQAGLMQRKSMRLRLDVGAPLDLVPIDRVVANAVTIAQATRPEPHQVEYYHLTNPSAPAVDGVIDTLFEAAGLPRPTYVTDSSEFDWLDEKFSSRIDFYQSYLIGPKTFDRTHSARIVGEESPEPYQMSRARVATYSRWYIDRLEEERAELPETR